MDESFKKHIQEILSKMEGLDSKIDVLSKQLQLQQADLALLLYGSRAEEPKTEDELYETARERVIEHQNASTAFLQHMLNIGYARAAALMDRLEADGVIGPHRTDGQPRDVLIKPEE